MSIDDTLDDHQRAASKRTVMLSNSHTLARQWLPIVDRMIRAVIAMKRHLPHNHLHYLAQSFDRMVAAMKNANLT